MSLSPIQLLSPETGGGYTAALRDGGNILTNALNNAVQIGRDSANNQLRQETAALSERRAEINLKQRRAELDQAQENTDRKFGEDVRQFNVLDADRDRSFMEGVRQFGVTEDRQREEFKTVEARRQKTADENSKLTALNILAKESDMAFEEATRGQRLENETQEVKTDADKVALAREKIGLESKELKLAEKKLEAELDAAGADANMKKVSQDFRARHAKDFEDYKKSIDDIQQNDTLTNPQKQKSIRQAQALYNKKRSGLTSEAAKVLGGEAFKLHKDYVENFDVLQGVGSTQSEREKQEKTGKALGELVDIYEKGGMGLPLVDEVEFVQELLSQGRKVENGYVKFETRRQAKDYFINNFSDKSVEKSLKDQEKEVTKSSLEAEKEKVRKKRAKFFEAAAGASLNVKTREKLDAESRKYDPKRNQGSGLSRVIDLLIGK